MDFFATESCARKLGSVNKSTDQGANDQSCLVTVHADRASGKALRLRGSKPATVVRSSRLTSPIVKANNENSKTQKTIPISGGRLRNRRTSQVAVPAAR